MEKHAVTKSLAQSALAMTAAVALSRIFGLVRETVIANKFGTSPEYDAFLIAFIIPHLLRLLLAEGALSTAFIPLFSEYLVKGREHAYRFASNVLTVALILFPVIVLMGVWLAPQYIPFLADGFDAEKLKLTAWLSNITFPFIMLMGIAAIFMGIQNSQDRFFMPAVASVFFNVGMIIGAFWIAPQVNPPSLGLALGVLLGGLGQLLFQIPSLRACFRYKPVLDLADPGLHRLGALMLPTLLGLIVVEINVMVDYKLASHLGDGQIASMQYAFRLFQLPLGLFAVALATTLLAHLSRASSAKDQAHFVATLKQGLSLAALIILPAAIGLAVLGEPIISLLFEHGRFGAEDTLRTASVLQFLSIALIGYGFSFLLSRAFYALQDTRTPVLISAIAVGVNILLALILVNPLGIRGLALATMGAGFIQMTLLAVILQKRLQSAFLAKSAPGMLKVLGAALVMGAAVYLLDAQLAGIGASALIRSGTGVLAGAIIYLLLAWPLRLLGEFAKWLPWAKRLQN